MFTGLSILLVLSTLSGPAGALLLFIAEKVRDYLQFQRATKLSEYCDHHNRRSLYLLRLATYCVASTSAFVAPAMHPDGLVPEVEESQPETPAFERLLIGADIPSENLTDSTPSNYVIVQTRSGVRYRDIKTGRFVRVNAA